MAMKDRSQSLSLALPLSTGGEAGTCDASKQTITVVAVCVAVRHKDIYVFLGRCMSGYAIVMAVIQR